MKSSPPRKLEGWSLASASGKALGQILARNLRR